MQVHTIMRLAACTVAITGAIFAFLLAPEILSSTVSRVSLALLLLAVASLLYVPAAVTRGRVGRDASLLALIGPSMFLSLLLSFGAGVALLLAMLGAQRMATAVNVLVVGGGVVALLVLRAATKVIDQASGSRQMSPPPDREGSL